MNKDEDLKMRIDLFVSTLKRFIIEVIEESNNINLENLHSSYYAAEDLKKAIEENGVIR